MSEYFDPAVLQEMVVRAFTEMSTQLAGFLPNLAGALLILAFGWAVSRVLEIIASRALRTIGLDRASARLGVADLLQRADTHLSLSQILARLLFWLVMLTFILSSIEMLGLPAINAAIDRVLAYGPSLIGAALIGVGGLLLARALAIFVRSGAAAAGFTAPARLGFLAQVGLSGLVIVVALEELGIATDVLILPVSVVLGTAGFAVAHAFAMGSRPVITHIMAGHFLKQSLPRDISIEIDGQRGRVERVGAIETLMRGEDGAWTVPNAQLMDRVVIR